MGMKFVVPEKNYFGKIIFLGYQKEKDLVDRSSRPFKTTHRCYSVMADKVGGMLVYVPQDEAKFGGKYDSEVVLSGVKLKSGGGRIQGSGQTNTFSKWEVYANKIESANVKGA
ncbi:hypothetical protein [Enterococcus faecalis]|uniref:hypothetical protein n=1 Tax=Enterococcus faecalis TaxID=1351 RepID=UPI001E3F43AD|nr:hypothetical protein [Enterococcus faecalis]MCD4978469.1 DUF961 family protein [Enterococcus faecalis]